MNTINSLRFFLMVILTAMWSCSDKDCSGAVTEPINEVRAAPVSYTHLTLPTNSLV